MHSSLASALVVRTCVCAHTVTLHAHGLSYLLFEVVCQDSVVCMKPVLHGLGPLQDSGGLDWLYWPCQWPAQSQRGLRRRALP